MAVASLVLGIIAMVVAFLGNVGSWVGSICGLLAIIFGAIGKKEPGKNGMATAGLVLGIISLLWGVIITIACIACAGVISVIGTAGAVTI